MQLPRLTKPLNKILYKGVYVDKTYIYVQRGNLIKQKVDCVIYPSDEQLQMKDQQLPDSLVEVYKDLEAKGGDVMHFKTGEVVSENIILAVIPDEQ